MSVTIPTRFDRPTLARLLEVAREVGPVALVHTEPGHDDAPGVLNLHDYRRNIHHWWNTGLDALDGPTLILNDDIVTTPETLRTMLNTLRRADLVYVPGRRKSAASPVSGWCFGVNGLRPDPAFVWYHGEDDLWWRAKRPRLAHLHVAHIQRADMGAPAEFAEAVLADRELFKERWGR